MLEEIALKKEVFEALRKEFAYIGLLFLTAITMLKIVYFKESLVVVLRLGLTLFWLFVLPGYSIMLYWSERLEFMERFVIGVALSAAIIGIASYYFGLLGLDIKYHAVLLPSIVSIFGLLLFYRKK